MSTSTTEILARSREFAANVIAPNAEHWEKLGRVPYDAFEQAGAVGLCGLLVPVELGGQGLAIDTMAEVMETFAKACMNSAFSFVVHNNLAGFIARYGNDKQIETYLRDLVAGRKVGAFLLTEPSAGSDAQAITTLATKNDSSWTICGEKAWASNAAFADVLSVFVQTDPGSGARGMASFLVDPENSGVVRHQAYELMRGHALGAGAFSFEQCEVDEDMMVLAPGTAFQGAMGGINIARINVAAMCCGMLRESLAIALRYAEQRQAFGQSTLDFQGLQWMLADAANDLEAAASLTQRAIDETIAGSDPVLLSAHAKKFATRVAFAGIANCMQVMGAAGYSASYPIARHLAAAKMAQFLDGTTEIQNLVIARSLVKHYGQTLLDD